MINALVVFGAFPYGFLMGYLTHDSGWGFVIGLGSYLIVSMLVVLALQIWKIHANSYSKSKFVWEPGELHKVEDCDECPGRYDKYNPVHLKLKTETMCPYCTMKKRLEKVKSDIQ